MSPILTIKDLRINFITLAGTIRAVDYVSFELHAGETLGVVGESGCGKSVMAMSILRLLPMPPGELAGGRALFEGVDLLRLRTEQVRKIRGNRISMIFQEPMTSLNPVFTIGDQVGEAIRVHQGVNKADADKKTVEILHKVGMPDATRRRKAYPHQLSGGMRQRAMIAMALSCNPAILIADEPTTALDVTVQAQIIDLMRELQIQSGMSIIMITHDLGLVAETADRVLVMYCGRVVESAEVKVLFENPLHPYTIRLLHCVPRLDADRKRLVEIPGSVPFLYGVGQGCDFFSRCDQAVNACRAQRPRLVETAPGHLVACNMITDGGV